MTRWAYVNSGNQVEELYYNLPESWRNISNLYALEHDPATLQTLGWYAVIDTTQPLTDNTQTYGGSVFAYDADTRTVTLSTPIIIVQQADGPSFDTLRNQFMHELRAKRDLKIAQSDWSQFPDVQALHDGDVTWQTSWIEYRQALRDLPELYNTQYLLATDVNQIIWPTVPGS